jgi:hypothetical protein
VIFDYDATAEIIQETEISSARVHITIPYSRLSYRADGEKYACDLSISAEIRDAAKKVITKKEEPFTRSQTEDDLKKLLNSQNHIEKTWDLDLPAEAEYIYIGIVDNVKGKILRKLLNVNKNI